MQAVTSKPTVQFPFQGFGRMAPRVEEVLLLCFYDPAGVSTVPETVAFMQSASRFSVTVLNLFEHRVDTGYLRLHAWVNLDAFSAVVIHNTISYNVDNLRALDKGLARRLREYKGVKILMKQDENYRFREVAQYIGETGFDVVFTCLPPEAVPLVYPPELAGTPRFQRMLTGYVTPTLRARDPSAGPRPIDIGYRGSMQPLSFGWLAYEKRKIGDDVARLLEGRGLALDISSRWEDRYGGDAWFQFLCSCKATLGAESGASIFDLDGNLDERVAQLEQQHAELPTETQRAEAVLRALSDVEDNVHYHQISPRHFEAAACGTVQLLYPGTYSGILLPGRHFFQLERDCSNLDEAVAFVRDDARRQEMAGRAFREVVLDPANWIETFVARVDDAIASVLKARGAERQPDLSLTARGHNVLLLAAHDPVIDPRLGWTEECAPGTLRVHQLGVLPYGRTKPRLHVLPRGNFILAHERQPWQPETATRYLGAVAHSAAGMAGAQELLFLHHALQLPDPEFCALFGAPAGAERNAQFRWYLRYLLDTAESLLSRAAQMRGVHAIIATDLDTLPAALILKGLFGVPVLYDAHEYWAESDVNSFEYEKQFWIGLERRMVVHVDTRQTVSPGLAARMGEQYAVPFGFVPNCEPADRLLPVREPRERRDGSCHFLFQGTFAAGRGIELLIQAWAGTDPRAVLQLRGPDNAYKAAMRELARGTGLLGRRIFFPEAVEESQLVAAAADADVGVIPYAPTGTNYRHCCPNKTSQYMAAGLPILANLTEFVSATVRAAGCGLVCDFSRRAELVRMVDELAGSRERRAALGQAGRDYFATRFNWNVASRGMYQALADATAARALEPLALFAPDTGAEPKLRPVRTPVESMAQLAEALVAAVSAPTPAPAPAPENAMNPEPPPAGAAPAPVPDAPPAVIEANAPAEPETPAVALPVVPAAVAIAEPGPPPPSEPPAPPDRPVENPSFLYRAARYLWRRTPPAVRRPFTAIARRVYLAVLGT